jgi:hypothetical protein
MPAAPSSWRETAAVLALFAMLLSALTGFMPVPSDALGIMAGDPASLCIPGGHDPNDHGPSPPRAHHSCPCCLTQPVKWAAILPAPAGLAQPVVLAADRPLVADPALPVARPHADSRPRAPPLAG